MGDEHPGSNPNSPHENADSTSATTNSSGVASSGETTFHSSASASASRAEIPSCIGPYVFLKKLGEGGMGQVWLAEQTAPVKRHVALKLIKGGMYDDAVIQRFESERQSLALMNHPAIAKVFDAGSTPDGTPYFVMEYVDGLPITRYCDEKKLAIPDRLALFIKVCEAVQHAHQKAIIHRDLKPSNILVVEIDGKPVPRIIDFGLAKAVSAHSNPDETQFTRAGTMLGTRGFMSPEQANPNILDVDTRTDVYSLGVVLYVLLAGTLPFDTDLDRKRPIDEILRQLREDDPPSPSARLKTERATGAGTAQTRDAEATRLVKLLQGDLDWITLKALERDRARRYGTPSEFAADITRYLENQPVLARPSSAAYRLGKYVRRHRIAVAAVMIIAVLLLGFTVAQAVALRRITQERDRTGRERDRANRERDRAQRVTNFMTDMFAVSDPTQSRGKTITARELLDKASKQIDQELSKDPELQSQMMQTMGKVYERLGLYPDAQSLLTRTLDIRRKSLGSESPEALETMDSLGIAFLDQGHYADAEKILRPTLDTRRRVLGPDNPGTLQSMNDLGLVLYREGRLPEAEKLMREALEAKMRVLGPEARDTTNSMNNVGIILLAEHKTPEAEKMFREVYAIRLRVAGPDAPDTLNVMDNLSNVLDDEGQHAEAEKLVRQTIDIETRVFGPEHPSTLTTMHNLGDILFEEGRYDDAEQQIRKTLAIVQRVQGPDSPDAAASVYSLGSIALRRGHKTEALADLRQAVDHGLPPGLALGIESDPDLNALHGDPRFAALVAHAKERSSAAQKAK